VGHVVKILATRATADKEAKIIVRNFYAKKDDKAKEEDRKIHELLLLPASETIIDSMPLLLFFFSPHRCNV
jgi:hypothetical protein